MPCCGVHPIDPRSRPHFHNPMEKTPDTTPEAQIQALRDQQTNTMLVVLAALSCIEGITLEQVDWPYLPDGDDESPQRYMAAVSFFVP